MIGPRHGMPLGVARVLVGALCGLGFGKKRVFGQSGFTPEFSMEGNEGASEARERWYFKLRCENSEYQTYCAAFEWVRQALKLNRGHTESVRLRRSGDAGAALPVRTRHLGTQ